LIQGGAKENIIPNQCAITLNRRFTPEEDVGEVRVEFRKIVECALKDQPDAR